MVLRALSQIGWTVKRQGSRRTLTRPGWPDYVFAFHEGEEIDAAAFQALVREAIALNSSSKSKPSKTAKSQGIAPPNKRPSESGHGR